MNAMPFQQTLALLNLERYLPAPDLFYSSAGSMIAATAFGASYGLIGRVVYPKAGILPLHYAIWFTLAFQVKYCVRLFEKNFETFMNVGSYLDELEKVPEDELDLQDQIRYHCWKVAQLRNTSLKSLDQFLSKMFHIRPYDSVQADNVQDASFLEMCRYRLWRVFKTTVLDYLSSATAYQLTIRMGFSLPSRTTVPLFIIISSIVKDILLIPSLYLYARFCNQLADNLGESDQLAANVRSQLIRSYLPAL